MIGEEVLLEQVSRLIVIETKIPQLHYHFNEAEKFIARSRA